MIDEYRAEQQNPFLLNNKTFTYHPGRLAVELETFTPQPVKISFSEVGNAKKEQKDLVKQIATNEKEIIRLDTEERKHIDDIYNANLTTFSDTKNKHDEDLAQVNKEISDIKEKINEVADLTNVSEARKLADDIGIPYTTKNKLQTIQNKIIAFYDAEIKQKKQKKKKELPKSEVKLKHDHEENERQYNEAKQLLENDIQRLRDENEELQKIYQEIEQDIKNSNKTRLDNLREDARIERDNKTKLKNLQDELTVLNSGAMAMAQGPGESDEDYKNRLLSTGQATFDEKLIEEQATSVQLVRCRYNLKNIVSDDGQVETIAKKLTPDQSYEYNKVATVINKKY